MSGSLDGVRVIAIEQAVAGPLCTRHLADLGADVVKVERLDGGDFARAYDDFVDGWASHFVWLNAGKRSIAVDIKSAAGKGVLTRLVRGADVLVSNLAPGALERVVSDAELAAINPRLIRCYISGYGISGPFARRKAYDLLIQGEAGTVAATGWPGQPAKPGVSIADLAGGIYAVAAINAALFARAHSGTGRRIDISMFDVLLEWMSPLLLAHLHAGAAPEPVGTGHASIVPYGAFSTAEGATLLLAVQNDGQWRRLCLDVLDEPDLLADPTIAANSGRLKNRRRVEAAVAAALARLPLSMAVQRLEAADVPYGRLNDVAEVVGHPQASATGRWSTATLPNGRSVTVVTSPFLTGWQDKGRAVPGLGEHSAEVLREIGLDQREVSRLAHDGVVGGVHGT